MKETNGFKEPAAMLANELLHFHQNPVVPAKAGTHVLASPPSDGSHNWMDASLCWHDGIGLSRGVVLVGGRRRQNLFVAKAR